MSLVSRCPACGTSFRVQRDQLTARSGTVRCGKCGTVFDGIAALVDEGAERLWLDPSPQLGLFDPSRRPREATEGLEQGATLPEFLAQEPPRSRPGWLWGLAAFAALAVLAGQAAYRYRAEIAATVPAARAPLEAACRVLRCTVPLPRRPDLMSIESSDLQADPRREGLIVLNAVLRNRAALPQAYPALELTLTDEGGRPVVRRVLLPEDYVVEGERSAQGIAPGGEASLRVYLDASRSPATSYRLYLFYPT
ncbi:MAG: family finger-like protein [Burkholderiales bacterium]|jgi:predicted Zn finger-like uncharacterized protein|nr:family finger-like protein [Burkholderiales bacterium]